MEGNWRFNLFLGMAAFIFTFLFSMPNNTWQTTLLRAIFGFLIFFILAFLGRYLVGSIFTNRTEPVLVEESIVNLVEEKSSLNDVGSNMDTMFQSIPLHSLHKESGTNKAE